MLIAVTACSADGSEASPATIPPAAAADSPPTTAAPDGRVVASEPVLSSLFDPGTGAYLALTGSPDRANRVDVYGTEGAPRTVALPSPATAVTGDGDGTAYLSTRGGYLRIDVAAGSVDTVEVTGFDGAESAEFTAVALRADGRVVLGSADGGVYTIADDGSVAASLKIFARVDSLAAQGDTVFALDRGQTSVTTVEPSGDDAGPALRAGDGATTMTVDAAGRVLVADTRGEQLLVFGSDPLILRQRYPVGGAPYGLAGSSDLTWVSETATNTVVGYDLGTGIPVEKVRYRTVRQPNSLAYDDETDTLYVASGADGGIQVITGAARG